MASPPGTDSSLGFRVAVGALFAAYLASAGYFAMAGQVNQDEGWYLYAAGLVYDGWLPYRDFAFFQAPLLPFLYGLPQKLFGSGLEVGRLTTLLLGAGSVVLGARLSYQRGGRCGALVFLALVPVTPLLVWTYTTTRTEPLNAFFLTFSAICLFGRHAGPYSTGAGVLAVVLAAGTRIASLPVALLVIAWVVYRYRDSRRELALALAPALLVAAALAAVVSAAGLDAVLFNLVTSQTERHGQLKAEEAWTLWQYVPKRMVDISLLGSYYGGLAIVLLISAVGAVAAWITTRESASVAQRASTLTAFAFAAYLPNMIPHVVYPLYFASVLPLLLVVTAWCVGHLYERSAREGRSAIAAGVCLLVIFQAGTLIGQKGLYLSGEPTDLAELQEAGEYLATVVPPDMTLATIDTYLAVESGRRVPAGWEMGIFSYFPALPNNGKAAGERRNLLTKARLLATLRDPSVGAVALSDYSLGVLASHSIYGYRPDQRLDEQALHRALPALRRFRLDRVFEDFGQFDDRLYVMLPAVPAVPTVPTGG